MKISTKLYLNFWLMIIFVMIVGLLAMLQMHSSLKLKTSLGSHPVLINNAVYEINFNIVRIQSKLKEIVLLRNHADLEGTRKTITFYKNKVSRNLERVEKSFMGDKQALDNVTRLFKEWKSILNEIIALQNKGQVEEATHLIFKGKGAEQVTKLEKALKKLTDSTKTQEDKLLKQTHSQVINTLRISIFMIIIILSGILIVFIVSRQIAQTVNMGLGIVDALATGNLSEQIQCDSDTKTEQLLKLLDSVQTELGDRINKFEKIEAHLRVLEKEKQLAEEKERIAEAKKRMANIALHSSHGVDSIFSSVFFTDDEENNDGESQEQM